MQRGSLPVAELQVPSLAIDFWVARNLASSDSALLKFLHQSSDVFRTFSTYGDTS